MFQTVVGEKLNIQQERLGKIMMPYQEKVDKYDIMIQE